MQLLFTMQLCNNIVTMPLFFHHELLLFSIDCVLPCDSYGLNYHCNASQAWLSRYVQCYSYTWDVVNMENVVLTKRLIPDILRASVYPVHVLSCEAHEHPCIPSSTSVLYGSFKVAFSTFVEKVPKNTVEVFSRKVEWNGSKFSTFSLLLWRLDTSIPSCYLNNGRLFRQYLISDDSAKWSTIFEHVDVYLSILN